MPCAVEEQRAISDDRLQNGCWAGEIGQRQQPQSRRNNLPCAKQENRDCENRAHATHSAAQRWPPPLDDCEDDGYPKQEDGKNRVGMTFMRQLTLRNREMNHERNCGRCWNG